MNCTSFEFLIALHVEGDLPESDRRRVEIHLQGCASCWDLAGDLRASQAMVKALRAGTVNSSDLAGVRERVLNEVGDLDPAPGWVVTMHRLLFAGLRRRTAIAGVVLAALISGEVWYSHSHHLDEGKRVVPVEVARLDAPSASVSPETSETSAELPSGIVIRTVLPETTVDALVTEDVVTDPVVLDPIPSEVHVSQVPMKFLTDDPNVIIYWLPADKGD